MSAESFTTGSIRKAMLAFVGPYMLGVVLQNLYGAVDLFVVGHFATTADVSAVTIGSQLMSMVTQLIIGFATGITVLVGQRFGAKDYKSLSGTVGTGVVLFGAVGVFLTALYLFGTDIIVRFMQTPPEAVQATREYVVACSVGILFIVAYNVISSILMGMGDSRTPFLFIAIACVINIVLDVVLVKYARMGALGAAIATSFAQAGSVVFALVYLRRRGLGFPFKKADIRFDREQTVQVLKIGAPVAVQNALVGASFLFITAIINQMGVTASAAVGVVEKLIGFLMIPAIAFGAAVATVSSQNFGAGQPERARQSMWYGVLMSLVPSVIVTLFCQFFGTAAASLFSADAGVIELAATYLRSYVTDCLLVSFVFSMNGYFNSSGFSWFTLLHSLLTTFALRVPLSFIFSRLPNTSLYVVGWAAPLSTLASLALCLVFLRWMQTHQGKVQAKIESTV